jgi:uncharacterized phage protein gp47/JayE
MPWATPSLREVRQLVRDSVQAYLPGADASVPNSVLRVTSDVQGALCHLTLQYLDWLSLQLFPDTAETIWLDRFAYIWLVNADGSTGRKLASHAQGTVSFTGTAGTVIPQGTQLSSGSTGEGNYETLAVLTIGAGPSSVGAVALEPGTAGNLDSGTALSLVNTVPGAVTATALAMYGGTDDETDDELRLRVLDRIREPPMGGSSGDYVQWALRVPGVTRAWAAPLEMGMGTCTVRFMMDDLRAAYGGFPLPDDVAAVKAYMDTVRPVAVKDFFVEAPIPLPVNLRISYLDSDIEATRGAITNSLLAEFYNRQVPGQTWYRAWSDEGIMAAAGVHAYDLVAADVPMPHPGYMPVLGDITYG